MSEITYDPADVVIKINGKTFKGFKMENQTQERTPDRSEIATANEARLKDTVAEIESILERDNVAMLGVLQTEIPNGQGVSTATMTKGATVKNEPAFNGELLKAFGGYTLEVLDR